MAARANWKGSLKIGELVCAVALYAAASSSDRIVLHTINRKTGHRVRRQFVDSQTGKPVAAEDQVKGYQIASGDYVVVTAEEMASAIPDSDKILKVSAFIACGEIEEVYFDRPYYLAPADAISTEAYDLICEGMRKNSVAAIAQTVLFRRVRNLLIRPQGDGLVATTLHFDYEVRSAADAFKDLPDIEVKGEMLELAQHIIKTKLGEFDPSTFDDRYESALADLVKAKLAGEKIKPRRKEPEKVIDLLSALRESAGIGRQKSEAKQPSVKSAKATPRRKAG